MVKNKVSSFAVRLAFLFLVIPDFTIIDFLPDFISYIILLSVIGNAKNIVPHLAEAYDGLKKMIFISIIKIPAMIFMLSNMLLGRDIIPLMTFTFAALELIVLIPTVKHAFAGLYYIGERGDATEILQPVKFCGLNISCEAIELICYIFLIIKNGLNLISQMFLLSSSNDLTTLKLRRIYPVATLASLAITLILGIITLIIVNKYFKNIRKNGRVAECVNGLMTPEQELSINKEKALNSLISPLNLFIVSQIFTLDITLKNVGEFNILPRFIFPILIFVVAFKLFDKKWQLLNLLCSLVYTVSCAVEYFTSLSFYERFSSVDLSRSRIAQNAYESVITTNIIELLCSIPMLVIFFIGIRKFIRQNTATPPEAKGYGTLDREIHKRFSLYFGIILGGDLLVFFLKCANAILKSDVSPLFTEAMDLLVAISSAPWLSALISGISFLLLFLSYYFVSQIKDEIQLNFNS